MYLRARNLGVCENGWSCDAIIYEFQAATLMDEDNKRDYVEDIAEEYEDVRQEHFDSLKVRFLL